MIICLCHRISDRDIRRAAEAGARTFEELQDETCIARNCACCEDSARELFDQARASACAGAPQRAGSRGRVGLRLQPAATGAVPLGPP